VFAGRVAVPGAGPPALTSLSDRLRVFAMSFVSGGTLFERLTLGEAPLNDDGV
jgi:hypothetical protein